MTNFLDVFLVWPNV